MSWQPRTSRNCAVPSSRKLRRFLDEHTAAPGSAGRLLPSTRGARWEPDDFAASAAANPGCGSSVVKFGLLAHSAQLGMGLYQIAALMEKLMAEALDFDE